MKTSKEYFEHAIVVDSNYAFAWYGLAAYYWWLGYLEFMPQKETDITRFVAFGSPLQNSP